ncbi:MAG: hypothetical protein R3F55_05800 [Alphaproteobacteria bacterium]
MADLAHSHAQTEAVGVFETHEALEAAVDDLLSDGFDRADVSLLADVPTVEAKLGHRYRRVDEVEDEADAPRTAFVSTETRGETTGGLVGALVYVGAVAAAGAVVASGGALAAALVAAAVAGGTGGMIGAALARLIDVRHAHALQAQIERGGLVLWVRTRDPMHEARAARILDKHGARDVHVHALD